MPLPIAIPNQFSSSLLLWVAIGLAIAIVISRVPLLRTIVRLGIWAVLIGMLVLVVGQRVRFDPYFTRIADALHLDNQQVVGHEVRIRMSPDGHFWARVRIDGVTQRLLIDSGATVTALSSETARAAGVRVRPELVPIVLRTANGPIGADGATIRELRLGTITARNLAVVVSPAFGDVNVLGMNFLSKLQSWRVEGGTLILVPHHPQATDGREA